MSAGAALTLRGVSHTFAGPPAVEALRDVDLHVAPGEFVAVVGASGSGKSTLLRIFAGLTVPTRGTATVGGASAVGRPGLVAFQPQRDLLMPWRRVLANATVGAEVAGVPKDDAARAARELLGAFGLDGFERAWPATLSGGMRQRVALLRTFLVPRPALLLDEPLGALDAITRREMQAWLLEVWGRDRRTVLFVTHDVEEALVLADRVVVLSRRPGRVVLDLAVEVARPRDVTAPDINARKRTLLAALSP